MPNHVHLVVGTAEAPLARFMQSLQQSYTQRFNRRYSQVGHVFQGRYTALLCATDEYLLTLVRYVHLNPVRAGLVPRAEDYPYSGHRAYLAETAAGLVEPTLVLGLVGGASGYTRLVDGDPGDPGDIPPGATTPKAPETRAAGPPGLHPPPPRAPLEYALGCVARKLLVDLETLRGPGRSRVATRARALAAYALIRRLGYRVTDVASALGREVSTISVVVRDVGGRLPGDAAAARQVDWLVEGLEVKVKA
jgi:hypothetical protein